MGFRRKIERSKMVKRSDVYGTDIFNDDVTISNRIVSAYRDWVCGEFDDPWFKNECTQYAADAESTDVKWFIQKKSALILNAVACHLQEYYNEFHNGT